MSKKKNNKQKANRNFKASMFTHLFREPENELDLYNAFADKPYPPDTPVTDLTLNDVLFMDRVNDLSFSIDSKLVIFFEHSSTINENIPLRYLTYCGRVYEKLIDNAALYSKKRVPIPTPEFYVLYNGIEPFPEKKIYRLSDSYIHKSSKTTPLELTVTAYNVNPGYNDKIIKRSKYLSGYVTFISKVRENEQNGMNRADAIKQTVTDCIAAGILTEYLQNNASEVVNMLTQEWDWDVAKEVWQKEAKEEGQEAERIKNAKRLLAEGLSAELIARALQMPIEEVRKLQKETTTVNESAPEYNAQQS